MRATTEEQKSERRESILTAAAALYEREEYESISVARVAAEARVAKGTVFVYFSSKEVIFLELAARAFEDWFAELERVFAEGEADENGDAEATARRIVGTLADRRPMLRLATLASAILERNAALEDSIRFKRRVLDALGDLSLMLRPFFPSIPKGSHLSFLLGIYGVILGVTAVQALPAAVRTALMAEPSYRGIDSLLDRLLIDTLASYIRGFPEA